MPVPVGRRRLRSLVELVCDEFIFRLIRFFTPMRSVQRSD